MPTALRDRPRWRQATIEAGLTLTWVAARTGKSIQTVQAYSMGRRRPSVEWTEQVEQLAADALRVNGR